MRLVLHFIISLLLPYEFTFNFIVKHSSIALERTADFLLFSLLQMFIFLDSKGLACVLNNLRTVKPHLFLTVFSSSFDELSIAPFLFLSTPSKERAGGEDVAGDVMSSELNHSRVLHYRCTRCQFENPCYGVRV